MVLPMPLFSRLIRRRSLLAASVLFLGFASAGIAAHTDSVLAQILSAEEFSAAGLDKLSADELNRLETALIQHKQLPAAKKLANKSKEVSAAAAADFGAEQITRERPVDAGSELRARVDGSVQDITGRTVFLLDNGQIWQQRIPDQFHLPRKLVNPEVVITRGLVGYKMAIVEADIVVFVKRIR